MFYRLLSGGERRHDTHTVAVSQSGRSAEILRLFERIGPEVAIIGVTNAAGSSLAKSARAILLTRAWAEHFAAEGMSCAAFRHGPMELVSPAVFVLVYEGIGATRALNGG